MSRSAFAPDSCVVAEVVPSANHGERAAGRRPDMIVLHYTGMQDSAGALELLTARGTEVSSHYFVFEDGRIIQLVQESRRAWHAGKAFWAGETDINSCSIGIEIANPGHDYKYPDFPARQIAAVTTLCRSIQTRNTIPPVRVLAHSDVAPARKMDPGEKFPWRKLFDSGVGHWVRPAPISQSGAHLSPGARGNAVLALQKSFSEYGYGVPVSGTYDTATSEVVTAFQRHFRQELVDGIFDASTRTTLEDLLAQRGRTRTMAARARTSMLLVSP
jgi:N-acetylmuramoyl-L-alanine amidase